MKITAAYLTLILLIVSNTTWAQGGPPPDPLDVPLDPMSWMVLASGAGIAAKKYYFDKKKKED